MRWLALSALVWSSLLAAVPLAGQDGSAPPRDPVRAPQSGSSVIRGRVLAADTGRPLRRARVTLTGGGLAGQPRSASTGLDGRYELRDLPPGRFNLEVQRSGYVTLRYGQRRPLEQGQPLDVRERETVEGIDFTLPRASVLSGRIVDELGDPVAGVQVFAMRMAFWQGRRRLVPGGAVARTDDIGDYRISDLIPGTYVVMAVFRETWTVKEDGLDRTLGYAPTYFPGTAVVTDAQRLTLQAGQHRAALDFSLAPGRAASVAGVATDSAGRPMGGRTVSLRQEITGPGGGSFSTAGFTVAASDGTFTIRNVPPGQYRLAVRSGGASGPDASSSEAAVMPITLEGVDVSNVLLTTSPGWKLAGQVVAEDGTVPQASPASFALETTAIEPDRVPDDSGRGGSSGVARDDWSFRLSEVFGAVRLRARTPVGWWVKAIVHEGRELLDTPLELRSGEELSGVRVVVSNRPTSVRGQLTDARKMPVAAGTVIVFARDPEKWFPESRWIRVARPDQQGTYRIDGLPPGDYLAIAVDYVEEGQWHDATFIASLRERAEPLTLAEGDARTIALNVLTP